MFISAPRVTIARTASAEAGDNLTTYSFADQAIGAAHDLREVLVIPMAWDIDAHNVTVQQITIGGTPATIDVQRTGNDNAEAPDCAIAAIGRLSFPSGTLATIGVQFSTTVNGCAIMVYRMLRRSRAPHATAGDTITGTGTGDGQDTLSGVLETPVNGAALAAGMWESGVGFPNGPCAWSGTGWAEDVDAIFDNNLIRKTTALKTSGHGNSTPTCVAQLTDGNILAASMVAASYGP